MEMTGMFLPTAEMWWWCRKSPRTFIGVVNYNLEMWNGLSEIHVKCCTV